MSDPRPAGRAPSQGATGQMIVDDEGRQVFVTPDGERLVLDEAPRVVGAGDEPVAVVRRDGEDLLVFGAAEEDDPDPLVLGAPAAATAATPLPPAPAEPLPPELPAPAKPSEAAPSAPPGAAGAVGGIAMAPRVVITPTGERMVLGADADARVVVSPRRTRSADGAHIELRSEDIQEIVGTMPHWLVRWGITAIALTHLVLLGISWWVKYPEAVEGSVTLTTAVPPMRLFVRAGGEVERLLVADGDRVANGAPLAVMRSPADWEEVVELSRRLDEFEPLLAAGRVGAGGSWPQEPSLGDVQPAYATFLQSLSDYAAHASEGWEAQRIAALGAQIASHERLRTTLEEQQEILVREVEIATRRRERDQELAARDLLSMAELEASESDFLQKQRAVEAGRTALVSHDVQLASYRSQMLEMQQRASEDGRTRLVGMESAFNALRASIRRWEQEHLLRAPVDGRVSFFRPVAEGQYVGAAEPVLAVLPEGGPVGARVLLPHDAAAKVRAGQTVRIRLDGHPAHRHGTVAGRVERMSLLAFEEREGESAVYLVEVSLPEGLVTSYGRSLSFRQEMRGTAQVIAEDRRLITRFVDRLRGAADAGS